MIGITIMTTRDVTSASRNLLIIYWVISAFCSYQLGIALRVTTKLVGLATFFLGFMSLMIIPILMTSSLGLCIFPKHTPHIWRKIRIPTIIIWIIVTLEVWLMDDGDAASDYPNPLTSLVNRHIGGDREVTYLLVAGVFFIIAAACYARILVIGMQTRSRTDAETQDTPPPPRTQQSGICPWPIGSRTGKTAPRDERIPSVLSWIGLSFMVPLGIMLRFGAMSGAEKIAWPLLESFIMYFTTFPLLLLGFVFLVYPKDQPPFLQAKVPFIGFWIMATLTMSMWMFPRIAIIHATHAQTESFDRTAMSLAVIALGFWLWLLGTRGTLRDDRTPPD
jgi:putative membrane protein